MARKSEIEFQLVPFTADDFERLCLDFPSCAVFWKSWIRPGRHSDMAEQFAVGEGSYLVRVVDITDIPPPQCFAFRYGGQSYEARLADLGEVVQIIDAPALPPSARLGVEGALQAALDVHGYWGSGIDDGMHGELTFEWE